MIIFSAYDSIDTKCLTYGTIDPSQNFPMKSSQTVTSSSNFLLRYLLQFPVGILEDYNSSLLWFTFIWDYHCRAHNVIRSWIIAQFARNYAHCVLILHKLMSMQNCTERKDISLPFVAYNCLLPINCSN